MAEDTPVHAPVEAGETARAEKPTEKKSETETVDDKPAESAVATDNKKDTEAGANKPATTDEPSEPKADGDDAAAAPADAAAAAPAEANGTPASAKKSSKNRRASGGANQSKLSRKKSVTRITHLDAKPGQYYLARLRSYAPWPSIICDDEILPESLLENRPVTAMQKDGSYKGEYADGGRRTHERTFPVMFFETNEFAWVPNTALTPLEPAECKEISEKNKTKQLISAYKVASEGHDLAYFKKLLNDHQAAIDQEEAEIEAEKAEKAAAKAAKDSKKGKRKSKGAETDVEMEDADDSRKSKASKKRKNTEADAEADKPAKTPKTNTKLKLTTPKAPEEKKTPASKTKKAATKKGKAASAPSDDEDASAGAKESPKPVDPEELKKKKEKEILFLRHKLQKGFISRDQPPKEDEMASMATYFDKLEKHADLEVSIIRSTKINKVLKMIVKLNSIPRDEDFSFRHRAMNILSSWKNILDADTPAGAIDKDDKPTANGSNKEDDGADTPKLETEEEKEPESKSAKDDLDSPMPDADAEKAPEPEKEQNTDGDKPTETTEEKTEEESTEKPEEKTAETAA
ncbi:uncharacterized protein N7446_004712 [Penicillium canescens]|uniref:PWWP domain-containing protein n=1 Tax=Penicillium canescens TaxID=5083 RepID=A0AAD6I0S3_PENCN|nr:uncharacterized protein N7446_004712 [Penicillium canescens]KAJ6026686.1 hypothetical protein N7460_011503 [Penicillium canescens]KAJ6067675.1 hypothetical protein N7446_004712 [Penicillium canescens]